LTEPSLIAETYAKPGQRVVYYLITDSAHLRNEAVEAYADKIVISGLHQVHGEEFVPDEQVPPGQLHMKKINYVYPGEMDTIAETWTYAGSLFRLSPLTLLLFFQSGSLIPSSYNRDRLLPHFCGFRLCKVPYARFSALHPARQDSEEMT